MFAESMLETSWAQHSRRSWTTATSFGLQAIVIAVLLTIPVLTTVGVPLARTVSTPITMGRRDPGPAPVTGRAHHPAIPIVPIQGAIMAPRRVPNGIDRSADAPSSGPGVDGPTIGELGPALGPSTGLALPFAGTRPIMPVIAGPAVRPFRTSSMLQGSLVHRVEPVYPPMARTARVAGAVVLEAIISQEGTMKNLRLVSGHPLLVPAAIDAVSQWRYRPYILNGAAIEVETQITVNFILGN